MPSVHFFCSMLRSTSVFIILTSCLPPLSSHHLAAAPYPSMFSPSISKSSAIHLPTVAQLYVHSSLLRHSHYCFSSYGVPNLSHSNVPAVPPYSKTLSTLLSTSALRVAYYCTDHAPAFHARCCTASLHRLLRRTFSLLRDSHGKLEFSVQP